MRSRETLTGLHARKRSLAGLHMYFGNNCDSVAVEEALPELILRMSENSVFVRLACCLRVSVSGRPTKTSQSPGHGLARDLSKR